MLRPLPPPPSCLPLLSLKHFDLWALLLTCDIIGHIIYTWLQDVHVESFIDQQLGGMMGGIDGKQARKIMQDGKVFGKALDDQFGRRKQSYP